MQFQVHNLHGVKLKVNSKSKPNQTIKTRLTIKTKLNYIKQ